MDLGGGKLCSPPPAPLCPKAITGGICALVQEGRAGQLVLEICPRHPGMAPLIQDRAVTDGTCISPLEIGVLQPRKKMPSILQCIQTPQSLYLPLGSFVSFSVLVTTPDFLLQQGSSSPWHSHKLMLGPEDRAGSYALSSTLARGKTPHHWHFSFSGLYRCLDLSSQACCEKLGSLH